MPSKQSLGIKIYCDLDNAEILTQEEFDEFVRDELEDRGSDLIGWVSDSFIWDMLTDEQKERIYEECKEEIITDRFIEREI